LYTIGHFSACKAPNLEIQAVFYVWHTDSKNVSMKRQLRYRTFTIALGIVVALLIVLTIWTHSVIPASPSAGESNGLSFAIKPVLQLIMKIDF
jgi:hypothetical protein